VSVQDTDTIRVATVRRDTLCRLNAARATHDLPALKLDRRLTHAALGHTSDMVASRFFARTSPGAADRPPTPAPS
jgi:uncharacterized protein YkwD